MLHPFLERLIGIVTGECLNRRLFPPVLELEVELSDFGGTHTNHRTHASLNGFTPVQKSQDVVTFNRYRHAVPQTLSDTDCGLKL